MSKQAKTAMAGVNSFLSRVEAHKAATPSRDPHAIRISDMPEEVRGAIKLSNSQNRLIFCCTFIQYVFIFIIY
jgi:hypothetical protein